MSNRFTDVKLKITHLDIYFQRNAIFNALKQNVNSLHGELLDVGCGIMPYKSYILSHSNVNNYLGLDIETAIDYGGPKPDLTWDGEKIPLEDGLFDCVLATEVFEHCPQPASILKEINRVLKPGGILFFTVPFLWPLHEVPHDEFRYTPFSLNRLLAEAGFAETKLNILGGWDAGLAQMLGLWVRRRPLPGILRIMLSCLVLPFIKILIKFDKKPQYFDRNQTYMITGISGIAKKNPE